MSRIHNSLIQSDFESGGNCNFEAVIFAGTELWHWFRENTLGGGESWKRGQRVTAEGDIAVGAGSIIQSDFRSDDHGNFEVVVPLRRNGRTELWHFFHDNRDVALPWQRAQRITGDLDEVAGSASIIQSDFRSDDHGNFEVVVPLRRNGRTELWHFFHDNRDVALPWQRAQRITGDLDEVAGSASIVQSDFRSGDHGNFEVVVPLHLADGVVEVRHFFHDNADVALPWQRGQVVSQAGAIAVALTSSDYGTDGHRNFEALVEEFRGGVVHYWHANNDVSYPWLRSTRFDMLSPLPSVGRPTKVVQLTGEHDRERWNGTGQPPAAYNRTASRWGVIGTDLGVSFTHRNREYFLFGDTGREADPRGVSDSVAFTTDDEAFGGLHLTFHPVPPTINPAVTQGAFDVPLDGVSVGGAMYVFFSTGHHQVQTRDVMGRSVLTRSDNDGLSYRLLYDVSKDKFINVSASLVDARRWGLPGDGAQLLIFGSGRYRSSDVYLAVKPISAIEQPGGWLYYAGGPQQPRWSHSEGDALPLFPAGSVGELSVRFDPVWQAWLCMFNDDNPTWGVAARWSATPWGPWSEGRVLFTNADGLGRFIHQPGHDHTEEGFGTDRKNDWGSAYGPYLVPRYSRPADGGTRIFFTLSVWNPYQVMLMTTLLPADRW